MKAETLMWRKLRPVLETAQLDPVRVENPVHPGTPDVNLCDGRWIELKCVRAWPVRARTKLLIAHFTPQQRVWLFRRWKYAPDTTYLLLEVRSPRQWLLFDGDVAAKIVGRAIAGAPAGMRARDTRRGRSRGAAEDLRGDPRVGAAG